MHCSSARSRYLISSAIIVIAPISLSLFSVHLVRIIPLYHHEEEILRFPATCQSIASSSDSSNTLNSFCTCNFHSYRSSLSILVNQGTCSLISLPNDPILVITQQNNDTNRPSTSTGNIMASYMTPDTFLCTWIHFTKLTHARSPQCRL